MPISEISRGQIVALLRAKKTYGVTLAKLGAEFGVSSAYMCHVLKGQRPPNAAMLKSLGVTKRTIYEISDT